MKKMIDRTEELAKKGNQSPVTSQEDPENQNDLLEGLIINFNVYKDILEKVLGCRFQIEDSKMKIESIKNGGILEFQYINGEIKLLENNLIDENENSSDLIPFVLRWLSK